jgi:hypothetical protein
LWERQGPNGSSSSAADVHRRGHEDEFVDTIAGQLFQIQNFDDVNSRLYQQVDVDRHVRVGGLFEDDGIGA